MREFKPYIPDAIRAMSFSPAVGVPLDIEIGCGVGWHPTTYALEHPERFVVALEHTQEKFDKFAARVRAHGSPANLLPLHANAISWIAAHIHPASVDRFFLLYPNPHPKESQRNQRWYAMPFMGFLKQCLKPGGELILATNESWYAGEACTAMVEAWGFHLQSLREIRQDSGLPPGIPRTHFEKKYLATGQTCFDIVFRKSN